jgi:type IV secretory pathway VirJ component
MLSARIALAQPVVPAAANPDIKDLPLRQVIAARQSAPVFAVFITGDGGWADIDKDVTAELADHGINVIGLDSRAYLHVRHPPDQVARDIERIVRHYQGEWHRRRFVLVGYSRGADLSPFIVSRMDSAERADVSLIAMIGLGIRAGFEFHFQDIFRDVKRPGDLPTLPELEKLRGMRMMCVYGSEEKNSGCRAASDGLVKRIERPGSHHYDGKFREIGDLILSEIR